MYFIVSELREVDKEDLYYEIDENQENITFPQEMSLPSETEHHKKKRKAHFKKKLKPYKYTLLICIVVGIYLFYNSILELFFSFLAKNPTLYSYYLYIESQISNLTLTGLFFFSILSTLFFLILPSEATFLYYVGVTDHFIVFILLFCILGNAVGMTINYLFGRILGERILLYMFKEKNFYKYKDIIDRYGGYMIFFGNIFPGPIEFIAVFYGGFKFSYKRYIYLAMIGRLIKYLLLFTAFVFYWDQITFYYNEIISFFKTLVFWK